ncbi:hypothetical protein KEM54_002840 [Ascosphaera aggregata]|nr:hypothetical protein KEM54_002840 [Ascosphaera aggregata]
MDNTNPWTRRGRGSKLTVSTSVWDTPGGKPSESPRTPRRFPVDSHTRNNPLNPLSSLSGNPSSPSTPASSAFRLGSGAFASFGSSGKQQSAAAKSSDQKAEKAEHHQPDKAPGASSNKAWSRPKEINKEVSSIPSNIAAGTADAAGTTVKDHPLKATWVVWYRPPTSKYSDYEKSTIALASISTVESFWAVYSHLKHPSQLPTVSDYHIFRKDIRPVWEDEANKKGGKWIVRLKKGVADRYWEELLLAIVGDQFGDAGDEICGAVLSVRSGEDVLSVWTRIDGGRNIRIRSETMKRLLAFPPDTNIQWKSHDDSIAQRAAVDQARHEKAQGSSHHHHHHHHRNHDHHNQGTDRRRQQQQQHHHHNHNKDSNSNKDNKDNKDSTATDEPEKKTQSQDQ